jgi:hypothetical protein
MISRSAGYAFIITSLLLFAFSAYGHLYFYRDPGSIFFDPNRFLERHYSLQREREAELFRHTALAATATTNSIVDGPGKSSGQPTICGVYITVQRSSASGRHPLEVCLAVIDLLF